jgi:hypothetical protein
MRELDEIAKSAIARIDAVIVRDVIAVVLAGRRLKRHQPDRGDAKPVQIIESPQQAFEIAHSVSARVHIGANGEAVDDTVLVPEIVDHKWLPHRPSSTNKRRDLRKFPSLACRWRPGMSEVLSLMPTSKDYLRLAEHYRSAKLDLGTGTSPQAHHDGHRRRPPLIAPAGRAHGRLPIQ